MEAWSGQNYQQSISEPSVASVTNISQEKRGKRDKKIEREIFISYSTQSKGDRVYNLRVKKLIINWDVKFDEDAAYNWKTGQIEKKVTNILTQPQRKRVTLKGTINQSPHSKQQQKDQLIHQNCCQ